MGLAIAAWSSFAVCSLPVMSAKAQQRAHCVKQVLAFLRQRGVVGASGSG